MLLLSFNLMFYLTHETQQVCNSKAYKCGVKCHHVRTQLCCLVLSQSLLDVGERDKCLGARSTLSFLDLNHRRKPQS